MPIMPVRRSARIAAKAHAALAEEEPEIFEFKGTTYFRSSANECWLIAPNNKFGAFAGIYDPATNTIVCIKRFTLDRAQVILKKFKKYIDI